MEYLVKAAFAVIVLAWWLSIGATEGWKWRKDAGKPDTNKLIWDYSYHMWRAVTNGAFLAAPMVFVYSLHAITVESLVCLLAINVAGWALYERTITYVEHDEFMVKRQAFRMGEESKFGRPPAIVEVLAGIGSLVFYFIF